MKLRWKDDLWISCPLKVNELFESHEIDAGMLTRWEERGISVLKQVKAYTLKNIVCEAEW